jgi:hypothetical protein
MSCKLSKSTMRRVKAKQRKNNVLSLFDYAPLDESVGVDIERPHTVFVARVPDTENWPSKTKAAMRDFGFAGALGCVLPAMASADPRCDATSLSIGTTSFTHFITLIIKCDEIIRAMTNDMSRRGRSSVADRVSFNFYAGPCLVVQRGNRVRMASFIWIPPATKHVDVIMKVFDRLPHNGPSVSEENTQLVCHEGITDRLKDVGYLANDRAWNAKESVYMNPSARKRSRLPILDNRHDELRFDIGGAPLGLSVSLAMATDNGYMEHALDIIIHTLVETEDGTVHSPLLVMAKTKSMEADVSAHLIKRLDLAVASDERRRTSHRPQRAPRPCWMHPNADGCDARFMTLKTAQESFSFRHVTYPNNIFYLRRGERTFCRINVLFSEKAFV